MELLHPPYASTNQFPAVVIPSHAAICFPTLANGKRKKESNHSNSIFNFGEFSFRTTSKFTSSLRASDSRSTLVTQEPEAQFKSSFDDYLKAMESVRNRREGIKERKEEGGSNVRTGNSGDGSNENSASVPTRSSERREKKGGSRTRIGSNGDGSRGGLRDSVQIEGEKAQYRRVSESNVKLKKFDGSKLNGSRLASRSPREDATEFVESVNLRSQEKRGSGFNKVVGISNGKVTKNKREDLNPRDEFIRTGRDGLFGDEDFVEDGVQGGRPLTRMEMEERIQKLAKCLNGADIDMPEWMFSKMMRSAQIRFSDHSILRVIQVLGNLGNWRRVLQVIEWLQMRERYKSHNLRYVYTAALDALGRAKRPVEALNVFRTMQQQKGTYPDLVAYHCIAVTLGQAGHMKELFDVMDSMRSVPKNFNVGALVKMDPRLEPDIVVYNAILNGCVRRKQWEGAFWVLQQLRQAGIKPSSTTYGLVMEVMLACGKYNLVHEFFEKMQRSSIPNALSYKVVVNALWREDRADEAIDTVQDMEKRGIVGSASLYYDLARCLCSAGRCQEALVQVDKVCKVATKPLVVTYTGLIQACINSGRVEDGAYIFNHLRKYCSPNLVTYNILLKAFLEHGRLKEAKDLFYKMLQNGKSGGSAKGKGTAVPDIYTFNVMLEALVEQENWDDFENAYEQMLYHGQHFNTKRHLWMVMRASDAGKVGPVETTWKHLTQEGRVPPPALVKERFRLKLQDNHLMAALSTVTSHPSTHQQAFSKEAWLELLQRSTPCVGDGLLQQLMCELDSYLSSGESPNLVLSNLLESCREFVRNGVNAGPDFVVPSVTTQGIY